MNSDKFNRDGRGEGNNDRDRNSRDVGKRGRVVRSSKGLRGNKKDGSNGQLGDDSVSGLGVSKLSNLHRDALEGNHLMLVGEDGKEFVMDFIDLAGRKRMISVIDGRRDFQGIGLGFYRGGILSNEQDVLIGALEDVSKRQFLRTLVVVDAVSSFSIESLAILDEIIQSGVQVIFVISDMEDMDEDTKWKNEDVLMLLKRSMRDTYRWGVEFSSMFGDV